MLAALKSKKKINVSLWIFQLDWERALLYVDFQLKNFFFAVGQRWCKATFFQN